MITARRDPAPCGACGVLVSLDAGCKHWKPMGRTGKTTGRKPSRRTLQGEAAAVANEFAQMIRGHGDGQAEQ